MATELYDAAVIMDQVLSRIEVCERYIFLASSRPPKDTKELNKLFELKSNTFELLKKVFRKADTDTKLKISALLTKRKIGSRIKFESAEAQAGRWIGNKGNSRETKSQIDTMVWESKAQDDSKIGGKFKKMLLTIYESVARLAEVPKGSFDLGSISLLFDHMWDNTLQLQLVSTEASFLATSMLTVKPLVHHVSTLKLCSEYIVWLCTWVPEFAQRLQLIEKDDEMGKRGKAGAEMEESIFASYIFCWEQVRRRNNCISFEDSTTLSSMMFTHYMPGHTPLFSDLTGTMQIFSIKVTELKGFKWPLEVYGMVAARDVVDYRRNILFLRTRDNCQFLNEQDSFLHLTGPSRAILSTDTVQFEFQLKVKGTTKSEDRSLITKAFTCDGGGAGTSIMHSIRGCFCRLELCCQHLEESIQATIVMVRVLQGSLRSANRVQVICSSLPEEDAKGRAEHTTKQVVLLDQKGGTVAVEGYLNLSRQVVSVQLKGRLEFLVKTFSLSGGMSGSVVFEPQVSNITKKECVLGECKLEITVAWSLLVDDEQDILMMSYTKPCIVRTPFPFMKLVEDTKDDIC